MSAANLRMNNKRNQYHLICRVISICLCALFCLSFGCTSKKEERLQEIDFTVVDDDEIPEELKTIIDQKKTGEFKLTYADQDGRHQIRHQRPERRRSKKQNGGRVL